MRVFIHYGDANSMAGELPCGTVENGQLEEYYVIVSPDPTGITDKHMDEWNVYPNPTDGILHISGTDTNVCRYRLYGSGRERIGFSNRY